MLDSKGRVVLISGANRGIGAAIARVLYREGYTLSLGARNPNALEAITTGWDSNRVSHHQYDALDRDTHRKWVDETAAKFGGVDVLINNAGVAIRVTIEMDDDEPLDQMWNVNVKAPLSMTRLALPHLRKSGHGRVLNVASIAGKYTHNNNIGYSMSKFAVVALSHATRQLNWDEGVRCTALCPSFVRTDMTADVESFPLDDMIDADDLAEVCATVLALPNNASIAEVVVNCRKEAML